jgi:hypothetical protein
MKFFKIIVTVFSILAVIVISFLWYLNFFADIKISEKEEGGYIVAGTEVIGPYSKIGKSMVEVDSKLRKLGIISSKGLGIYYDDPKITPKEKCRSFVGNILIGKDLQRIKEIESKGLKIDSISKTKALVAEFPLKNSVSYMIGPMKVYPILSKHMKEKKYTFLLSFEIYDHVEKKIIFVMQYI